MTRVRQIQKAKNKLGERVEEAAQRELRAISRGTEAAVILGRTNLAQFFLESPLRDSELDLTRDRRPASRASIDPSFWEAALRQPEVEFPGGAAMTIQLTEEQQRAMDSAGATLTQVVDPRTSAAYVLIPVDDYEAVREILRDERQQKAFRTVALRNAAGRIQEAP
jgi:hypothetical protein